LGTPPRLVTFFYKRSPPRRGRPLPPPPFTLSFFSGCPFFEEGGFFEEMEPFSGTDSFLLGPAARGNPSVYSGVRRPSLLCPFSRRLPAGVEASISSAATTSRCVVRLRKGEVLPLSGNPSLPFEIEEIFFPLEVRRGERLALGVFFFLWGFLFFFFFWLVFFFFLGVFFWGFFCGGVFFCVFSSSGDFFEPSVSSFSAMVRTSSFSGSSLPPPKKETPS